MDYEKKYKEALERCRDFYATLGNPTLKKEVEVIFPELKESEDERICKNLIAFLKQCKAVYGDGFKQFDIDINDALAWLEKQDEQKPAEWSEEDNSLIENICIALNGYALHERKVNNYEHAVYLEDAAKKLKSLRPQNRWKPSEEQIEVLDKVVDRYFGNSLSQKDDYNFYVLKELKKQLKAL